VAWRSVKPCRRASSHEPGTDPCAENALIRFDAKFASNLHVPSFPGVVNTVTVPTSLLLVKVSAAVTVVVWVCSHVANSAKTATKIAKKISIQPHGVGLVDSVRRMPEAGASPTNVPIVFSFIFLISPFSGIPAHKEYAYELLKRFPSSVLKSDSSTNQTPVVWCEWPISIYRHHGFVHRFACIEYFGIIRFKSVHQISYGSTPM